MRRFLRIETALVVLVLMATGTTLFLFLKAGDAKGEVFDARQQLTTTLRLLDTTREDNDALREELTKLEASPLAQSFPSLEEALTLDLALLTQVVELGASLNTFNRTETSVTVEEKLYSALSYTVEVQGTEKTLTDILGMIESFPTAVIQSLEFTNPQPSPGEEVWVMKLILLLFYEKGMGEASPAASS